MIWAGLAVSCAPLLFCRVLAGLVCLALRLFTVLLCFGGSSAVWAGLVVSCIFVVFVVFWCVLCSLGCGGSVVLLCFGGSGVV